MYYVLTITLLTHTVEVKSELTTFLAFISDLFIHVAPEYIFYIPPTRSQRYPLRNFHFLSIVGDFSTFLRPVLGHTLISIPYLWSLRKVLYSKLGMQHTSGRRARPSSRTALGHHHSIISILQTFHRRLGIE